MSVHIPAAAWIAPRLRRFRFFDQELAADLGTIHGSVITYTYHEWPPPNPPVNPAFSAALKRKVQRPRKNDTGAFPARIPAAKGEAQAVKAEKSAVNPATRGLVPDKRVISVVICSGASSIRLKSRDVSHSAPSQPVRWLPLLVPGAGATPTCSNGSGAVASASVGGGENPRIDGAELVPWRDLGPERCVAWAIWPCDAGDRATGVMATAERGGVCTCAGGLGLGPRPAATREACGRAGGGSARRRPMAAAAGRFRT